MIRPSRSIPRNAVAEARAEILSNVMTHRVLELTRYEMNRRESLDSAKVAAPKVNPRFAPFLTLTVADIDALLAD